MSDKQGCYLLSFVLLLFAVFIGVLAYDNSKNCLTSLASMFIPILTACIVFLIGVNK